MTDAAADVVMAMLLHHAPLMPGWGLDFSALWSAESKMNYSLVNVLRIQMRVTG